MVPSQLFRFTSAFAAYTGINTLNLVASFERAVRRDKKVELLYLSVATHHELLGSAEVILYRVYVIEGRKSLNNFRMAETLLLEVPHL